MVKIHSAVLAVVVVEMIGCASRAPSTQPATSERPLAAWSAEGVVDLRGIWRDDHLEDEGARRRGLDPSSVQTPVKTHDVPPHYPRSARDARIQGDVLVYCIIGIDGRTRDCQVQRSLSDDLDHEALEAIKGWRYQPLRVAGEARPALAELTISYRLSFRSNVELPGTDLLNA